MVSPFRRFESSRPRTVKQMITSQNKAAVVLAAGKGTRMKSELPKVAIPVSGKPMIQYVLENLRKSGIQDVVIVVGYKREDVIRLANTEGLNIQFAVQESQNGTAHALLSAEETLKNFTGSIIVASGDMPMIQPETFRTLMESHQNSGNGATVLSSFMEDPTGYGRLVRNSTNELMEIIEEKDAADDIREIKEVNTGTYIFESPEIFDILKNINSENKQKEFYLTDAVSIFRKKGVPVGSVAVQNSDESLGANSIEDVKRIEERMKLLVG